jgi:hypothetical protein
MALGQVLFTHPHGTISSTDRPKRRRRAGRGCFAGGMNLIKRISQRAAAVKRGIDRGMSTAEYAVGTVAAVAFAVVLYKVVRSDAVSSALASIVNKALHAI